MSMSPLEPSAVLEHLKAALNVKQFPQALLLQGLPETTALLAAELSALLLCQSSTPVCQQCQSCQLVELKTHPDLTLLSCSASHPVKIDQIRELQSQLYLPAQLGPRKVVLLSPLTALTQAASQALLKILEEPPQSVYFIALTQGLSGILPTILSRFQRWTIPLPVRQSFDYLDEENWRAQSGEFQALLSDWPERLDELHALMQNKASSYELTQKWAAYPLEPLLQLLYCIIAKLIQTKALANPGSPTTLTHLSHLFTPLALQSMLDELKRLLHACQSHIAIQPTLSLEAALVKMKSLMTQPVKQPLP